MLASHGFTPMQGIPTSLAPVLCSMEGGVTKRTLSTRRALPGRTRLSTSTQTLNLKHGLPTQSVHPQGLAFAFRRKSFRDVWSNRSYSVPVFVCCYRPVRGCDPLASPAGEAASPGNWMFIMPSASSATPFSPAQATYDMQSRAQQHHMHSKHTSQLRNNCNSLKAQQAAVA